MDSGLKYTTTSEISSIMGNVLLTSMTICPGDSGGPAILEGPPRVVVGVASFGEAGECPSRTDGYNLVEPFVGLIDAAIIAAGDCPFESDEVCNAIDDDCDGTVDEGCRALGESCTADDECAYAQLPSRFEPLTTPAFCGETPVGRVCTRACNPTRPVGSCASTTQPFVGDEVGHEGVYCAVVDGCNGVCAPGEAGSAADGVACSVDTDCASLRCTDPGDGTRRCLSPCVGSAGLCPVSEVCAATAGSCGSCVPPALVSSRRGLGEGCEIGEDCVSGMCRSSGGTTYCSRSCMRDDECGDGFHCAGALCALGTRSRTGEPCVTDESCILGDSCSDGYCTHLCSTDGSCPEGFHCDGRFCALDAGRAILGEPCTDEAQCTSGTCAEVGDGTRCTTACGGEGTCPPGLECRRVGESVVCVPPSVVPRGVETLGGGGGCSASGFHGSAVLVIAFAGLLPWARRRMRRGP
jgi:hypothetical protein